LSSSHTFLLALAPALAPHRIESNRIDSNETKRRQQGPFGSTALLTRTMVAGTNTTTAITSLASPSLPFRSPNNNNNNTTTMNLQVQRRRQGRRQGGRRSTVLVLVVAVVPLLLLGLVLLPSHLVLADEPPRIRGRSASESASASASASLALATGSKTSSGSGVDRTLLRRRRRVVQRPPPPRRRRRRATSTKTVGTSSTTCDPFPLRRPNQPGTRRRRPLRGVHRSDHHPPGVPPATRPGAPPNHHRRSARPGAPPANHPRSARPGVPPTHHRRSA